MSKSIEDTDRTLLNMYNYRDNVVNNSRSNTQKEIKVIQNDTVTNEREHEDTKKFVFDLNQFLTEQYDQEEYDMINYEFIKFLVTTYDTDKLYSIFYNHTSKINDIEVEHYHFLFREVREYTFTQLSNS